jgi:hypothetical protein
MNILRKKADQNDTIELRKKEEEPDSVLDSPNENPSEGSADKMKEEKIYSWW